MSQARSGRPGAAAGAAAALRPSARPPLRPRRRPPAARLAAAGINLEQIECGLATRQETGVTVEDYFVSMKALDTEAGREATVSEGAGRGAGRAGLQPGAAPHAVQLAACAPPSVSLPQPNPRCPWTPPPPQFSITGINTLGATLLREHPKFLALFPPNLIGAPEAKGKNATAKKTAAAKSIDLGRHLLIGAPAAAAWDMARSVLRACLAPLPLCRFPPTQPTHPPCPLPQPRHTRPTPRCCRRRWPCCGSCTTAPPPSTGAATVGRRACLPWRCQASKRATVSQPGPAPTPAPTPAAAALSRRHTPAALDRSGAPTPFRATPVTKAPAAASPAPKPAPAASAAPGEHTKPYGAGPSHAWQVWGSAAGCACPPSIASDCDAHMGRSLRQRSAHPGLPGAAVAGARVAAGGGSEEELGAAAAKLPILVKQAEDAAAKRAELGEVVRWAAAAGRLLP